MQHHEIKGELIKVGSSQSQVARELGVTSTTVYHIVSRRQRSQRVAEYIAKVLNLPLGDVFPEYATDTTQYALVQ